MPSYCTGSQGTRRIQFKLPWHAASLQEFEICVHSAIWLIPAPSSQAELNPFLQNKFISLSVPDKNSG